MVFLPAGTVGQRALCAAASAAGTTLSPELSLALAQQANPLLQDWSLKADWTARRESLGPRFSSAVLEAKPLAPALEQWSLTTVIWTPLWSCRLSWRGLVRLWAPPWAAAFSASGALRGPLNALQPNLDLQLSNPRAGTLQLVETWSGQFEGLPAAAVNWHGFREGRLVVRWRPTWDATGFPRA